MPASVLFFQNYSHKISHLLFSSLFWHNRLKPTPLTQFGYRLQIGKTRYVPTSSFLNFNQTARAQALDSNNISAELEISFLCCCNNYLGIIHNSLGIFARVKIVCYRRAKVNCDCRLFKMLILVIYSNYMYLCIMGRCRVTVEA